MAQVNQRGMTVGVAARRVLKKEFPSLADVHALAQKKWSEALKDYFASIKSELLSLEQSIRLVFVRYSLEAKQNVQLASLKTGQGFTSTLRIPQLVDAHEVPTLITQVKDKPVLLHVGSLQLLQLDFSKIGHLLGQTKFLHLEIQENISYFDLYYKGECYNSFLLEYVESALMTFFFYQRRDLKKTLPKLHPLGKKIGSGAYGEVYKVAYGNQLFAVKKIIQPRRFAEDFEREKEVLMALTHPRIIPLLAYNSDDYCLVMPWMAGGDLYSMINSQERRQMLSKEDFVLKLAYQIADGLLYLHSTTTPWMHRDLKSHNILLTSKDSSANCVISDFGSAKLYEEGTKNTLRVGTTPYMAPEVENSEYALPADIYSFGAVLVELIACKALISPNSVGEFLNEERAKSHPLYSVAFDCCNKDPNLRPTAQQVFDTIKSAVSGPIPNFIAMNDISYICTWVQHRVLQSNTQYPTRSPNGRTELKHSFRVTIMLQNLESDVKAIWSEDQRKLIANGLRNQTYCRNLTADEKALLQKNLTANTDCCIYFYSNNAGECYVGKTDRSLQTRHAEHVKRGHSNFDRRMKTEAWRNVEPIPICTYQDYSQMTRYEVLHVLVFHTAKVHDEKGLNTMHGGDWGASNVLRTVDRMDIC